MTGARPAVHINREGPVVTLTLQRPPLNPIDSQLRDALSAAVRHVADDDSVRACVIHGGPRHFAAGADIAALSRMDYREISRWNERLQRTFTALAELPVPVIAAINGYALGGGLELALAADIRVGSRDCVIGLPEVKLGIIPGSGGTQRLTQIVGRSTAKQLIFSGRHVQAAEALALGLLDEMTDPGDTLDRAIAMAREFATASPHALRAAKLAVDAACPVSPEGLALERSLLAGTFATPQREESMRRFLERDRTDPTEARSTRGRD